MAESFAVVTAFPGDFGFKKAAIAAGFGFDFFGRKNEPIWGRVVWRRVRLAQHFVRVVERYGGIERSLAGGGAFGFQVFEGLGCVRQDSVEALFVHAQVYKSLGVVSIDGRGGEGGMDLRMFGIDLGFGSVMAESEHAVFESTYAVETPLGVDDGFGHALALGEGFRGRDRPIIQRRSRW